VGEAAPNNSDRRLDSWKDIARFFERDERTVRRWEKENALPVHRVPGGAKGRVFAYESELRRWLSTPQAASSTAKESESPTDAVSPESQIPLIQPDPPYLRTRSRARWTVALAVGVVLASGIVAYRKGHRFAVHASTPVSRTLPGSPRKPAIPEAEDFYLKGRYFWNKRTPESLNQAVDYFTQAIVRDPNYAPAYVGLADCYNLLREYASMPPAEAYPRALAAAKKAVELDDQSSEAHASLAFALFYGMWDVANADREFLRAIELDPNNAVAHHWYATYLMTLGRFPESFAEIERAQTLNPSSTAILADKGLILLVAGRWDEGIALLKQMEATEPAFRSPHSYLKGHYLEYADYPNFLIESRQDALLLHDKSALAVTAAAEKGYAAAGARGLLHNMLQEQTKLYAQGLISPCALADTYVLLGNKTEALRYLNIAFEQHDASLLGIKNVPGFKILHNEPAYRSLIQKMNFPMEN
jgi:tetratricopeptide (TPR) repeat protein